MSTKAKLQWWSWTTLQGVKSWKARSLVPGHKFTAHAYEADGCWYLELSDWGDLISGQHMESLEAAQAEAERELQARLCPKCKRPKHPLSHWPADRPKPSKCSPASWPWCENQGAQA